MNEWLIALIIITAGIIFIYAVHRFSNNYEDPIFEISELTIDSIRCEDCAMSMVKVLTSLGYELEAHEEKIFDQREGKEIPLWKIWGRRRYINNRNDPATAGLDDFIVLFNDCVDTIRKMGSVKIEITQGAGALDINLTQTKPIVKPGAVDKLRKAGILKAGIIRKEGDK